MANQVFYFKQFHIHQDRCAMKVGTDGILLGAWAEVHGAKRLLDFGTGTGLLALMLAQRTTSESQIVAVELEESAFLQAKENIETSPWSKRIQICHQDILEFSQNCQDKFDVIVANPPYFKPALKCKNAQRELARYTTHQCHLDWLNAAERCLNPEGKIHFILPFEEGKKLQKQTALSCLRACEIITRAGKSPQRLLLTFSQNPMDIQESQLIIYDEQNQYTPEFIELTKDFYLKFA